MEHRNVALCRSALALSPLLFVASALSADWPTAGRDLDNSRYQSAETAISPQNAGSLQMHWVLNTSGDVTANPTVDGDYLYFPDSAGFLYKVRRSDGGIVWKFPVSKYTGIAGDFARASPAVAGQALILGNQSGKFLGSSQGQPDPQPARVFAVDKVSGDALWTTQVDETPLSFVTHSAIVADGVALVGLASNEELVAAFVPKMYWQWHFRGSVVALDTATGAIRWKTYTVPEGYAGGAVWGSTGAVDLKHGLAYMATGNNYMVPDKVLSCLGKGRPPEKCMSGDNHFNSIIALDLASGAVRWAGRGLPYDAWSVACGLNVPGFVIAPGPYFPGVYDNCPNGDPSTAGPDWDFAQGPLLFGETSNGGSKFVGAGQKSGVFWAFKAATGELAWSTQVAPGGVTGGLQWGSATDGDKIYAAASNSGPSTNGGGLGALDWQLVDGTTTKAGGWAALDARTGAPLWTAPDIAGSRAEGAVSGANGVIFGCNMAGTLRALNAATGETLWSYETGLPCTAGPSIADGVVYWGSGNFFGLSNRVFAFGLPPN